MRSVLFALLVAGCGGGATGKLALSWQFADGRRCPDTGAASMAVSVNGGAAQSYACADGVLPQAITLDGISADGAHLEVQALSTESTPLYDGTLDLDALPMSATVTLYADKMR